MIPYEYLLQLQIRISTQITHTQLAKDLYYIYESLLVTGLFEACGALARLLSLKGREINADFVTNSVLNHELGPGLKMVISGTVTTRLLGIIITGGIGRKEFYTWILSCFAGITI